jgi:hypothetical protein
MVAVRKRKKNSGPPKFLVVGTSWGSNTFYIRNSQKGYSVYPYGNYSILFIFKKSCNRD